MTSRHRRRGFTFLEMAIALAIFVITLTAVYMVFSAGQSTYTTGITRQELDNQVRLVLDEMTNEIRQANPATLQVAALASGDQSLTFFLPVEGAAGFDPAAGRPNWQAAPIQYVTEPSEGELDNGLDDNNNGLTDERRIVRVAGAQRVVMTDFLREGTLAFTLGPPAGPPFQSVRVTLTLDYPDQRSRILSANGASEVSLRNQ
ncbi:MAG: prepilin-type N-terminal cleavage/methylation domain-containing protein [Planctomycetes bacterium]|nr:prepilin-type N-terminal cleavage/methylation domain-containing protein [Planctomycetota bacterium]